MRKRELTKKVILYIAEAIILIVLVVSGIYQCPTRLLLGVPCPFCGMTRAFVSLARFNIVDSFYYHPLWPIVVIAGIVYILTVIEKIKLSERAVNIGLIITGAVFIICFIIRHKMGSEIVRIDFSDSVLGKLIQFLTNSLES